MEADQVSFCLQVIDAILSNQLLLDAGCGAGGTSLILHETFSCCIEGFTLSPKQAEYANAVAEYYGCSEQVQFFVGDILNLPRSANHFDVVWACENTEHLPNLNSMYQEFSRVTRAGGRLIIVAWCATTSPMGHSIKGQVDDHYKTDIHTRAEYLSAAQTNGWSLRRQVEMTSLTAPYWELRSFSKHRTGSESFMWEGFSTGTEEYHLFEFERD
jgi:geranyl diphosphate 2-C-methyltransferase